MNSDPNLFGSTPNTPTAPSGDEQDLIPVRAINSSTNPASTAQSIPITTLPETNPMPPEAPEIPVASEPVQIPVMSPDSDPIPDNPISTPAPTPAPTLPDSSGELSFGDTFAQSINQQAAQPLSGEQDLHVVNAALGNDPTQPAPAPASSNKPAITTADGKKKSKLPIIITAAVIVAALAIVVVAIVLSNQKPSTQPSGGGEETTGDTTEEPEEVKVEYAAKDRITKSSYDYSNINDGVTLDVAGNYTFTPSTNVSLSQVTTSDSSPLITVSVKHEEFDSVDVQVYAATKTISELDEVCSKNKNCSSDYVDGAKTLLLAINSGNQVRYSFYSKSDDKLMEYRTLAAKNSKVTETSARNILIKAAMTISGKSEKPYIYDLATFFKMPGGKQLKSYKHILAITPEYTQLSITDGSNLHLVQVFQNVAQGVAVSEVSKEPKVGSYTSGGHVYFRFYDGDDAVDALFYTKASKGGGFVKDLAKAQAILEKVCE